MKTAPSAAAGQLPAGLPGGWESFVESYWERAPLYLKDPLGGPFADEDWLFRVILRASASARRETPTQSSQKKYVRFCIEHYLPIANLNAHLPYPADGSLDGYAARLSSVLGGRDFTLITNNSQGYDFDLWARMRAFVSGLYELVGVPLRSEVVIYVSNAPTTAAGVHKDPYSNFLFQVRGRKRFRLWPGEVVRARPELARSLDYEGVLGEAQTVDLEPGDLLYMPSGYYHVAETSGELCAHVSIIVGTDTATAQQIAQNLATQILKERLGAAHDSPFLPAVAPGADERGDVLPASMAAAVGAFRNLDAELHEQLGGELVRLSTALGCELPPPLLDAPPALADDDLVEPDAQSPVAFRVRDGRLYFAANGRGFACTAHPNALRLLEQLRSGGPRRVGDLAVALSGTAVLGGAEVAFRADDVRRLLETLHLIRAVRKVGPAVGATRDERRPT
jgi:50S ribosomal protein L16 3-hydroxylase